MRGGETQPFDPRQQMRGQTYEIFHYRDTGLGRVSIHHHDFYEIYLFLEGNIEFLAYLKKEGEDAPIDIAAIVEEAHGEMKGGEQ